MFVICCLLLQFDKSSGSPARYTEKNNHPTFLEYGRSSAAASVTSRREFLNVVASGLTFLPERLPVVVETRG